VEVAFLQERWVQVQQGQGQVVVLSGDAGLGKSRLVWALSERLTRGLCLRQLQEAHDSSSIGATRAYSFLEVSSRCGHAKHAGAVNLKKLENRVTK
jgi:hypothetical protein